MCFLLSCKNIVAFRLWSFCCELAGSNSISTQLCKKVVCLNLLCFFSHQLPHLSLLVGINKKKENGIKNIHYTKNIGCILLFGADSKWGFSIGKF
jgi:hypothetical protein